MAEEKTAGIWFIIILFVLGAIVFFVAGTLAIASPMSIINLANSFGISGIINGLPIIKNMFGIGFNGQPLLGALPGLGALVIIVAIVVVIDIFGLLKTQGWAWILTVLASIVMIPVILGIIYLWILFREDTKTAFGKYK